MKLIKIIFLILASLMFLMSCKGGGGSSTSTAPNVSSNPSTISGVAAIGAPIPNATVVVKDKYGQTASTTTAKDGSYSLTVSQLSEPYIVKVTNYEGDKYVTLADSTLISSGKKINITPLSHIIAANVLSEVSADSMYNNFGAIVSSYSTSKLLEERDNLKSKLTDAGLIGASGVAPANVDLLNGEFTPGTSVGVDAILDSIDINATDKNVGVEIKLKGNAVPIITDKVNGVADSAVVAIDNAEMTKATEKLSVLSKIRDNLTEMENFFESYKACVGVPVDNGGACDIDTMHAAFLPILHPDFSNPHGDTATEKAWEWFCGGGAVSVYSKADCLVNGYIQSPIIFKDVSLVSYDGTTEIAVAKVYAYENGVLLAVRNKRFKKSGANFKLLD